MAGESLMVAVLSVRQPLRWFGLWSALGWMLVLWVVYESLTPNPIQTPDIEYGDKIGHFMAYFLMMGWFVQLYQRGWQRWLLLLFITLGVAIEFIQGQSPYRLFEYADMAANSLGASTAWLLAHGPFSAQLLRIEQRLVPKPR